MPQELINQKRTFNLAAPGANTDFYTADLTPVYPASTMRVSVRLSTASVLNLIIKQGATTFTTGLNASAALQAGDLYTFVFGINGSCTYNFQVETDGVISYFQVDELSGVVA